MSALALAAVGCQKAQDRQKLDEISQKLDRIAAQLEKCQPAAGPQRPTSDRLSQPDLAKVYSVPIQGAAVKGPADALVTIVESLDFQCPYCRKVSATLKEIVKTYGEDVRVAVTHYPLLFHNRAMPAAIAAECAGEQGKFWEYHDKLFEEQQGFEDETFRKHARDIGLDMGEWEACVSSEKPKAKILNQQKQAATMGVQGTPSFFINGRFLSGAQPFERFKAVIDREVRKAKESGVPRGEYYQKQVVEKGEKEM